MKREEELIEEALQGNHIAFEQLLHPYSNGLLNMVYQMTGNPEDAKEICQDALIKIYRYLHSFKKGRSFKNWVYKTVVNTARDFLKEKGEQVNNILGKFRRIYETNVRNVYFYFSFNSFSILFSG